MVEIRQAIGVFEKIACRISALLMSCYQFKYGLAKWSVNIELAQDALSDGSASLGMLSFEFVVIVKVVPLQSPRAGTFDVVCQSGKSLGGTCVWSESK